MITLIFLEEIVKMLTLHLCILLLYYKITARKEKNIIVMSASILGITVLNLILYYFNFNFASKLLITGLVYSILLGIITKNLIHFSVIATLISYAVTFIANIVGTVILYFPVRTMINDTNAIWYICILEIITILFVCMILRIKRFENGLSFLKNNNKIEILNVGIFIVSLEIILYSTIVIKPIKELKDTEAFSFFVLTSLFMGMLIFMSFRAYYKSLQTQKIINKQNEDIKAKDEYIANIDAEHDRVTKKLHETSHKVKAMASYLTRVTSMNVEFGEDRGDLLAEIKELQEEISINSAIDDLEKTNVLGIDVMLSYMQNEALKNNIEFELVISGDIDYMIKNIVDKKALEKMIANHIQDSIIAIKVNEEDNKRKISVHLGKFSEYYELVISDSGIDFEINTLVNLGLKRITTHQDVEGTGIGFMATFENLQKCKGSLEIVELRTIKDNIYSKSVSMIFDNKNEYRVYSNRVEEIRLADDKNRIILDEIKKDVHA